MSSQPKKTCEVITESGNDYILAVKGNQPNLFKQIQINTSLNKYLMGRCVEIDKTKGRYEIRTTEVYKNLESIDTESFIGLKRIIKTTRYVKKGGKESTEIAYHISSLAKNKAEFFAKHIRSHWGVENRLHWVKDVQLKEDISKTKRNNAPTNLSIMRNILINVFRLNGYDSIKSAIELSASNFKELMNLIYYKSEYNSFL